VAAWNQTQNGVRIGIDDHRAVQVRQGLGFTRYGVDVHQPPPKGQQVGIVGDGLRNGRPHLPSGGLDGQHQRVLTCLKRDGTGEHTGRILGNRGVESSVQIERDDVIGLLAYARDHERIEIGLDGSRHGSEVNDRGRRRPDVT
jgi:hypothetical protein